MAIGNPVGGTQLDVTVASTTWNVPYPGAITSADVLVMELIPTSTTTAISLPSGWSLVGSLLSSGSTTPRLAVYVKAATGSESGSLAVTMPSATGSARMYRVRNVDLTTPQDVTASTLAFAATTAYNIPGVTTVTNGAMLMGFTASNGTAGTMTPPTAGGTWTEIQDDNTVVQFSTSYLLQATAGATGTINFVRSGSVRGAGILLALRPASSAVNYNGDATSASTGTLAADGLVGVVAAAAIVATAVLTATGVVGTSSDATISETATITATGTTGTSSGATVASTAALAASGVVGVSSGATLASTATLTAAGTVTAAGGGSAVVAETATLAATGLVGRASGATRTETATLTAAGTVGKQTTSSIASTAALTATGLVGRTGQAAAAGVVDITAAGVRGISSDAATTLTVTITATGVVSGDPVDPGRDITIEATLDAPRLALALDPTRIGATLGDRATDATLDPPRLAASLDPARISARMETT